MITLAKRGNEHRAEQWFPGMLEILGYPVVPIPSDRGGMYSDIDKCDDCEEPSWKHGIYLQGNKSTGKHWYVLCILCPGHWIIIEDGSYNRYTDRTKECCFDIVGVEG